MNAVGDGGAGKRRIVQLLRAVWAVIGFVIVLSFAVGFVLEAFIGVAHPRLIAVGIVVMALLPFVWLGLRQSK